AATRKAVAAVPHAIRKQVHEHLRAVARPLPDGRAPDREAPEVWLSRTRAELSQDDGAYRGQRVGAIARPEPLAGAARAPATTRALAARVLAAATRGGETRPRIDAHGMASPEDAALIEAVAAAESDAAAQRLVRRRRFDFEP